MQDYEQPSEERDREHFYDFYAKVQKLEGEALEQQVAEAIAQNKDIHFHTWTFDSFTWRSVWAQPAIEGLLRVRRVLLRVLQVTQSYFLEFPCILTTLIVDSILS